MPRASDYLSFFSSSSCLSSHPFLGRLLSFGASSSSSSASPPPELALETPQPPTATAAMDIESGAPSPAPAIPGGRREDAPDARRVAKLVQPVALAAAAGSLVLFVNAPAAAAGSLVPFVNAPAAADGHSPELHSAYLALVCLGLFTSLGLSMHAVVSSGDPVAVAPLHKRLLLLAITFVLCAAVVRFLLVVPGVAPLHYVLAFLLLGALASILFLRLAGNIAQGEHTTGRARA